MCSSDQQYSENFETTCSDQKQSEMVEIISIVDRGIYRSDDHLVFPLEFYAWKKNFWKKMFLEHKIKNIVAPMVEQSELAFRMMMRANGADLCYTPMIHAHLFANDPTYRRSAFFTSPADRPLIVQFCANNPHTFLAACKLVEGYCDGVDLNLGCPQIIAKKGFYGAYLQDSINLIEAMVSMVYKHCKLPLSVKIRRLDSVERTVDYARRLENAGASMLAIHGRTREQKGPLTGRADWSYIRAVKQALDIPVIANGNIQLPGDVDFCVRETGVDAVMSAEGILSNPCLFLSSSNLTEFTNKSSFAMTFEQARNYMHFAKRYKAETSMIRSHVFRICHYSFLKYPDIREKNATVFTFGEFIEMINELEQRCLKEIDSCSIDLYRKIYENSCFSISRTPNEEVLLKLVNSLPHYVCKPYIRPPARTHTSENNREMSENSENLLNTHSSDDYRIERRAHIEKLSLETGLSKRCIKKREKRKRELIRSQNARQEYPRCTKCKQPASPFCNNEMCRRCCKFVCLRSLAPGCKVHCFRPNKIRSEGVE